VKIKDWMNTPVHTVKPRDSVAHARSLLERHRINQLPVVVDGAVVGIVTDRDLVVRGLAHECGPLSRVETIMTTPVITIHETQDAFEAAAKMARAGCRRLPVVSATLQLRGVVALDDIMPMFTHSADRLAGGARPQ
jgi:CBS domain-containing protein